MEQGPTPRSRSVLALGVAWALCALLAGASGAVFVQGVLRDTRPGGAELALDLSQASDWREARFGAGPEPHVVYLTTLNHDPERVGLRLEAALELRLVAEDGSVAFALRHPPDPLDHRMPDNLVWTELGRLERLAPGDWTLSARVLRGDPRFADKRSAALVRPVRPDPGMGGLVNYAMMLPAVAFGALALALALALAVRGRRVPLLLTCAVAVLTWGWLRFLG